jgi:hypothetical protein
MKVQEPNIKDLTSFGRKKDSEKERRKKKRSKTTVHSQKFWRRYNHVKVQGWSPCIFPIHSFLMFKPLLMLFKLILPFFV